jgi:FxsC-like protein
MPLEFFISYSRRDYEAYDEHLTKFLKDLATQIKVLRPTNRDEELAFFDQDKLARGAEWKAVLLDALQNVRTLVCLYSPNYFTSEYCGKEWQAMHLRRQQYFDAQHAAGQPLTELPRLIKPVQWVPHSSDLSKMSEPVGEVQYSSRSLTANINTKGLLWVMRRLAGNPTLSQEYNDFVDELAAEILNAPQVDRLPGVLDMEKIPNAFIRPPVMVSPAVPTVAAAAAAPPEPTLGPSYVHFVYVVAKPAEVQQHGRLRVEGYSARSGREWQPFFPPKTAYIAALAVNTASGDGLGFIPAELPPSANLDEEIEERQRQHNLVILLVDSWTAGIAPYRDWLRKFDQRRFFNCSVLVPLNEQDQETAQSRKLLDQHLQMAFPGLADEDNNAPLYYCGPVTSEDELRLKLQKVLLQLREKVKRKVPLPNAIPSKEGLDVINATGDRGTP